MVTGKATEMAKAHLPDFLARLLLRLLEALLWLRRRLHTSCCLSPRTPRDRKHRPRKSEAQSISSTVVSTVVAPCRSNQGREPLIPCQKGRLHGSAPANDAHLNACTEGPIAAVAPASATAATACHVPPLPPQQPLRCRKVWTPCSRVASLATQRVCSRCAPAYDSCAAMLSVRYKIHGRQPRQLSPGWEGRLACLVGRAGINLTGSYVRAGCIELTLDLVVAASTAPSTLTAGPPTRRPALAGAGAGAVPAAAGPHSPSLEPGTTAVVGIARAATVGAMPAATISVGSDRSASRAGDEGVEAEADAAEVVAEADDRMSLRPGRALAVEPILRALGLHASPTRLYSASSVPPTPLASLGAARALSDVGVSTECEGLFPPRVVASTFAAASEEQQQLVTQPLALSLVSPQQPSPSLGQAQKPQKQEHPQGGGVVEGLPHGNGLVSPDDPVDEEEEEPHVEVQILGLAAASPDAPRVFHLQPRVALLPSQQPPRPAHRQDLQEPATAIAPRQPAEALFRAVASRAASGAGAAATAVGGAVRGASCRALQPPAVLARSDGAFLPARVVWFRRYGPAGPAEVTAPDPAAAGADGHTKAQVPEQPQVQMWAASGPLVRIAAGGAAAEMEAAVEGGGLSCRGDDLGDMYGRACCEHYELEVAMALPTCAGLVLLELSWDGRPGQLVPILALHEHQAAVVSELGALTAPLAADALLAPSRYPSGATPSPYLPEQSSVCCSGCCVCRVLPEPEPGLDGLLIDLGMWAQEESRARARQCAKPPAAAWHEDAAGSLQARAPALRPQKRALLGANLLGFAMRAGLAATEAWLSDGLEGMEAELAVGEVEQAAAATQVQAPAGEREGAKQKQDNTSGTTVGKVCAAANPAGMPQHGSQGAVADSPRRTLTLVTSAIQGTRCFLQRRHQQQGHPQGKGLALQLQWPAWIGCVGPRCGGTIAAAPRWVPWPQTRSGVPRFGSGVKVPCSSPQVFKVQDLTWHQALFIVLDQRQMPEEEDVAYRSYVTPWLIQQEHIIQVMDCLMLLAVLCRSSSAWLSLANLVCAVAVAPSLFTILAYMLLPYSAWARLVLGVKLARYLAYIMSKGLSEVAGVPLPYSYVGYQRGLVMLLHEGLLLPLSCLLPMRTATILTVSKLLPCVAMMLSSGAASSRHEAGRKCAAVAVIALPTTALCHAYMRMCYARWRRRRGAAGGGGGSSALTCAGTSFRDKAPRAH